MSEIADVKLNHEQAEVVKSAIQEGFDLIQERSISLGAQADNFRVHAIGSVTKPGAENFENLQSAGSILAEHLLGLGEDLGSATSFAHVMNDEALAAAQRGAVDAGGSGYDSTIAKGI